MEYLNSFVLSFIPLFVAIDPVGIMPMYLTLTKNLSPERRNKTAKDSILTAAAIGIVFVFGGKFIFRILGITFADFAIAGGLLLFTFSILDLLREENIEPSGSASLGVFPIGTPLIAGPAVLTTLIILVDTQGFAPTLAAFALNLAVLYLMLYKAHRILPLLGENGARAFAKVMSILLAAIAIMLVRRGILEIISTSGNSF